MKLIHKINKILNKNRNTNNLAVNTLFLFILKHPILETRLRHFTRCFLFTYLLLALINVIKTRIAVHFLMGYLIHYLISNIKPSGISSSLYECNLIMRLIMKIICAKSFFLQSFIKQISYWEYYLSSISSTKSHFCVFSVRFNQYIIKYN